MRIVINARLLIPGKLDGIGWFIYETCRRMIDAHPDVEFHFLFDRRPPLNLFSSPNVKMNQVFPPARRPFLFDLWFNWSIPGVLKRIGADVFVSPDGLGSIKCPCPQVVVVHDINFERYPEDLPPSYMSYLRRTTYDLVKSGAVIATVSEFSKREIAEVYGADAERIRVVSNAASEVFQPLPPEVQQQVRSHHTNGNPFFLFVSSIHPRKNLPRLLRAFDRFITESGSTHRLVIVGSVFWMFGHVKDTLRSMAHSQRVVFTYHVERNELARLMGSAEALCFISYYEGFGVPVLEAFQSGTPVITSAGTAMEEVAGGAAVLVDPFNEGSIAQALSRVANDSVLRDQLRAAGVKRSGEYSWDRSAQLLWDIIQGAK